MLVAHLLGGICYPSRVMLAHRITPIRFAEKVASWINRLSWLFNWGRVKLLFVERRVQVKRVREIPPFLGSEVGRLVSDYLLEVLERRQGMTKQTYRSRVVMTALISRYARAAASTDGGRVEEKHVKEGIGIAELLFSHQGDSGQSLVLHQLRLFLMANREDYRRLLAAEVAGSSR
jgi:lysine-N-methylase